MKIFISIFILLFVTGCKSVDQATPNIPNIEDVIPDVEDSFIPSVEDNSFEELLLSYVFIDVLDEYKITLPNSILNNNISWYYNDKTINTLTGYNDTYVIKGVINNVYKDFEVTFINNKIYSIYQQDLLFRYMFVTDNKKLGTSFTPSTIVLHNTGNTASALNEVSYLNASYNNTTTSYHYAVDDIGVYQAVRTNIYAHHAGNLAMNQKSIGVEIAKSMLSDNSIKDKAIQNGIKLIRLLQMHYSISDVITHKDVTGKHCPHDIIDRYTLQRFYDELNDSYII